MAPNVEILRVSTELRTNEPLPQDYRRWLYFLRVSGELASFAQRRHRDRYLSI